MLQERKKAAEAERAALEAAEVAELRKTMVFKVNLPARKLCCIWLYMHLACSLRDDDCMSSSR